MLPFSISLRPGTPIHEQVVYAVRRAVVTGQLRAGDPFPSVRALSLALKINPNTAHKIVGTLTDEGLLTVRPGIGTIVAESRPGASAGRGAPPRRRAGQAGGGGRGARRPAGGLVSRRERPPRGAAR